MAAETTTRKKKTSRKSGRSARPSSDVREPASRRESAGSKSLVIVESPAKAKTINKYLGSRYVVRASMGHVRDLPETGLAVDIDNDFAPTYHLVPGRRKVISELRKLAENAETVFLATDLDREGEAIAWHLAEALELGSERTQRVVFNEITQSAIQEAFSHPRSIDMAKVNAQQARRILDRIVGYELSPLLWKKIAKGLSAGRVQSVAVRMIVEREKEIRAFVPTEHWSIDGAFALSRDQARALAPRWTEFLTTAEGDNRRTQKDMNAWLAKERAFQASLVSIDGKEFKPTGTVGVDGQAPSFESAVVEARDVAAALGFVVDRVQEESYTEYEKHGLRLVRLIGHLDQDKAPPFTVGDVQTKRTRTKPSAPFTTATLQQAGSSFLSLSTTRTMQLAQALYEGIELPGEDGPVGLITYMRTDSTNLSGESLQAARGWIERECGGQYLPDKPNFYGSAKRAQEAHEAIRPTDVTRTPESLKDRLSGPHYRLYDLIWRRFVACQMNPAEWDATSVSILADTRAGRAEFKATGRVLVFDGFYRVMGVPKSADEQTLPKMEVNHEVAPLALEPRQQYTSPPPRYSEAALVKRMEAEGIGRPSTYAAIIQTIQDRGYVDQVDRRLYATDKGMVVTDKLVEHFPDVMEYKFTSLIEDELDKIEEAHLDWVKVLHDFYDPFHKDLLRAHDEMEAAKAEPSDYTCELCNAPMVYRWARTGRFLSCSNYPECKGAMNIDRQGRPVGKQQVDAKCEVCGKDMILRQSRHGFFLGCSGYPECNATVPCDNTGEPLKLVTEQELEEPCTACGEGTLKVRRKGFRAFLGCDQYPKCKVSKPLPEGVRLEKKSAPVEEAGVQCERCKRPMVIRSGRRGKFIACSGFPRCRNSKPIEKLAELQASQPITEEAVAAAAAGAKTRSAGKGKVSLEELGTPPPGFAWTRTGKPVVETWPEGELHCPECGNTMTLKAGRFGPFYSCTNFPKCRCSVNLRGEAKKRAEVEMPQPAKPKPIPTDVPCDECGEPMLIRTGRSGKFLGCSKYPKCKFSKPLPAELESVAAAAKN